MNRGIYTWINPSSAAQSTRTDCSNINKHNQQKIWFNQATKQSRRARIICIHYTGGASERKNPQTLQLDVKNVKSSHSSPLSRLDSEGCSQYGCRRGCSVSLRDMYQTGEDGNFPDNQPQLGGSSPHQVTDRKWNMDERERGRERKRLTKEARRRLYNLHYQSIIPVITALLSRLQNGLRSLKSHVFVSTVTALIM